MKKLIVLFFMLAIISVSAIRLDFRTDESLKNDESMYQPNVIYLKVNLQTKVLLEDEKPTSNKKLNKFLKKYEALSVKRAFRSRSENLNRILIVEFDSKVDLFRMVKILSKFKCVEYVERIPIMRSCAVPNDESYSVMQHLPQIMAEQAWDIHKGEDGENEVIIAIEDDGVHWRHPDLRENIWNNLGEDLDGDGHTIEFINDEWVFDPGDENGIDDDGNGFVDDFIGWDFINEEGGEDNDPTPAYENTHGTHCAGIAAGVTNNELGISSISWNVKIMSTNHNGDGLNYVGIVALDAVIYAAENNADIINMSWGGGIFSEVLNEVVQYADELGSILIAASGNESNDLPQYPSSYPNVISVSSVASNDNKASYSSYGIGVDLAAPGGDIPIDGGILSTIIDGGYDCYQGTSMATPLVAGLAGLIHSYNGGEDPELTKLSLLSSADNIDAENPSFVNQLGSGRINAYRALTEENSNYAEPLRVGLSQVITDQTLNPGFNVNFDIELRNYANFSPDTQVTMTLSADNDYINVTNNTHTAEIVSDDFVLLEDAFSIYIDENTPFSFTDFTISLAANNITTGAELTFTLPVGMGDGILIWDMVSSGINGLSGTFIKNYFNELEIEYDYQVGSEYEGTLFDYRNVFISLGSNNLENVNFDQDTALALLDITGDTREFLEAGGNIYIEGSDAMFLLGFESYFADADYRLALFGLEEVSMGVDTSVNNLQGQQSTFTENLTFNANTGANESIDLYEVNESGIPIFIEEDYGIVGVYNEGEFGQKTICFSYSLSNLVDNESSSRISLLQKILTQFEIATMAPIVCCNCNTGHAPLEVEFTDLSYSNPPITSWQWDFDNDGTVDSEQQNPSFVFENSNIYDVRLTVFNGQETEERIYEDFIKVFDGTSSLNFNGSNSKVTITATEELNFEDEITIEAWIQPKSWGQVNSVGYGSIITKGNISLMTIGTSSVTNNNTLGFWVYNEDGESTIIYTEENALSLNEWSYIAMSYNASGEVKFYIDGEERETFNNVIDGAFQENIAADLLIGRDMNSTRTFDGDIDEVRIWNVVRTEEEIALNYQSELTGNEANLVGYWNFNEGNGPTLLDQTTNENNGSIINCLWDFSYLNDPTSIDDNYLEPLTTTSLNNYPNPFNPTTIISFTLPENTKNPKVEIFNVKGQLIKTKSVNETGNKGSLRWNGESDSHKQVPAGIYLYRIKADNFVSHSRKMLLLK